MLNEGVISAHHFSKSLHEFFVHVRYWLSLFIFSEVFMTSNMLQPSQKIQRWLEEGRKKGATHLLAVMDLRVGLQEYPVYVMPGHSVEQVAARYDDPLATESMRSMRALRTITVYEC
jgi:hypothetical protein